MRRGRPGLALGLAPLAAPLVVWAGAIARGLIALAVSHAPAPTSPPPSIAAALVGLFAITMFGAPLSYAATLAVLWPLSRIARDSARRWWTLTIAGAIGGGVLMPVYLHVLAPRGSVEIFPGAGLAAGAAVGLAFWYYAAR